MDWIDTFGGLRKHGETPESAFRRIEHLPSPEFTKVIGSDEGQRLLEAATNEVEDRQMALNGTGPAPKPSKAGKPTPITAAKSAGNGKAAAPAKEGPICLCGCGEHTKGGKFRPGHDARYHAAEKKKAEAAAMKAAGNKAAGKGKAAPAVASE